MKRRRYSSNLVSSQRINLHHVAGFYNAGDKDGQFHNCGTPQDGLGETVTICCRLLPIPVGWATMFLDSPSMGTVFCRLVKLMQMARKAERILLWPFCEGMALACGSHDPTAINPISAINSKWKHIAYTKAVTSLATAVWEGHHAAAHKPPPKAANRL